MLAKPHGTSDYYVITHVLPASALLDVGPGKPGYEDREGRLEGSIVQPQMEKLSTTANATQMRQGAISLILQTVNARFGAVTRGNPKILLANKRNQRFNVPLRDASTGSVS